MQRGIATFTLDYGKCPRWLFERMVKLGREMTRVLVAEFGPDEFIRRIADPSYEDPARYSFAHCGKDGTPYPVDRDTYDQTIAALREAVRHTRISPYEKDRAIKRLTCREV